MPKLTIQLRLFAVLGLIVAMFSGAYWLLRLAHLREADHLLKNLHQERSELLGNLVTLKGESLRDFAGDYSFWDEMLTFVQTGDPAWANANIDVSLATFDADGVWVLAPNGRQVYGATLGDDPKLKTLPLPIAELLPRLAAAKFLHFHLETSAGFLEFRTAPIQPTADSARATTPQGWFIVARLWDTNHVNSLRRIVGGTVALESSATPPPALEDATVRVTLPLRNLSGDTIARLRSDFAPAPLVLLMRENENEKILFVAPGVVMIAFLVFAITRWVLRPLRQLETSLATGSAAPLLALKDSPDTFGRLAKLIESAFADRQALQREVEERRRVEAALRQSEQSLRQAGELRSRLARDLHDGVIQSIYATGLGLEGVRSSLGQDTEGAERRLNAAQASLNHTIREIRSFIQGLEPEDSDRPDFPEAVQSLVSTLQALHTAHIHLENHARDLRLSPREEVHALQIIRECVSNAHRHGRATNISVQIKHTPFGDELTILDDGQGFDVSAGRASGGSGLANLHARAADIGAKLIIVSSPGKGTGVTLRFSPR